MNTEAIRHISTNPKPLQYSALYADCTLEHLHSNNHYVAVLASGDHKALLSKLPWSVSARGFVCSAPGKPLPEQLLEIVPFLDTAPMPFGSSLDICRRCRWEAVWFPFCSDPSLVGLSVEFW